MDPACRWAAYYISDPRLYVQGLHQASRPRPKVLERNLGSWEVKAKFHYAINRSEAGRRPAASRNLAYHLARQQRASIWASRSATGLQPASDLSATKITWWNLA